MPPIPEAFWPPVDRVLVADDDRTTRVALVCALEKEGFDVVSVADGDATREVMLSDSPPQVLLLDWSMPGLTGPEVCRWVRTQEVLASCHLILVTARDSNHDVVEGLGSGADDYIRKPFQMSEVIARVRAGRRIAALRSSLETHLNELQSALAEVNQLRGLIPICSHCHSIRTGPEHWLRLESYIEQHSEATFSHSICTSCMDKHYPIEPEDLSGEDAA